MISVHRGQRSNTHRCNLLRAMRTLSDAIRNRFYSNLDQNLKEINSQIYILLAF